MKQLPIATLCLVLLSSSEGQASVFYNSRKWLASPGGIDINICIVAGSSDDDTGLLDEIVYKIQKAVDSSWGRTGAVRFHDWRRCSALTPDERSMAVGLYIHPDADNKAFYTGESARGHTYPWDYTTSIKPWGNNSRCNPWNSSARFDCAEQYAIHELGHVLGFVHEMQNPSVWTPAGCHDSQNPPVTDYATTYPNSNKYTVFNPNSYDWDSIMAYDVNATRCAAVTGERFGSPTLDRMDEESFRKVYPAPIDVPILYTEANYKGSAMPLYSGAYGMYTLKIGNDTVSSLRVPSGWLVKLCTDAAGGGSCPTFTSDTSYVGDALNDTTSSVIVNYMGTSPDDLIPPVYVYEDSTGDGRYQLLWAPPAGGDRTYELKKLTIGNDLISAIHLPGYRSKRVKVVLWENADCTGNSKTFYSNPKDVDWRVYVGDDFNDKASCARISVEPAVWRSGLSSSLCLDVQGGVATPGANVQVYTCSGSNAQKWTSTSQGEIRSVLNSSLCLDVKDGIAAMGNNVQLYTCNGTNAQRWIRTSGEFRSALDSRYCLDVQGGLDASGTNVQIYTCNGTNAQKWN